MAGKTPYTIRMDSDTLEKLKTIGDKADLSVSQIVNGVLRWAVDRANVGEPDWSERGEFQPRQQAGCLWFGQAKTVWDTDEDGNRVEDSETQKADILFALDFTERRVVKEKEE